MIVISPSLRPNIHGNFLSHASKGSSWDVTTTPAASFATGKIEGLD